MTNLVIVGTGDFAEVAAYFFKESNQYNLVAFAEERAYIRKENFCDLPVIATEDIVHLFPSSNYRIFVAIGPGKVNTVRERIYLDLKKRNYSFATYIHRTAFVWDNACIGENSIIFPHVVIEPFAKVGNNCVLWSSSVLAHHSVVDDNCFIAPGAKLSGKVHVKKNCFIGINATIRDHVIVEANNIIGAGAVIKKNTIINGVYSHSGTAIYNQDSFESKL